MAIQSLAELLATTPLDFFLFVGGLVFVGIVLEVIRFTRRERRRMAGVQVQRANALKGLSTRALLGMAGWYPERLTDLSAYEERLRAEGVRLHPEALQFLRQFNGLEVEHLDAEGRWDFFRLEPVPGRTHRSGTFREQNEELVEIGEAHVGFVKLLMGSTGRVYGEVDGSLVRLGADGHQALDTLCMGKINWRTLMHKNRRAD